MTFNYIDLAGLSTSPKESLRILQLEGEIIAPDLRVQTLARATKAGSATIITGAIGAKFYACAHASIKVLIVPENIEYKERLSIDEWAAYQTSNESTAKKVIARKSPPVRGALVKPYAEAKALAAQLREMATTAEPLGGVEKVEIVRVIPATKNLIALDWEWQRSDHEPVGLAVSTASHNYYMPVRAQGKVFHTTDYARHAFSQLLRNEMPVVLHNGRADIGTQYDGDPIELFGKPIDDTLIMGYLADPYNADLGLKSLTSQYLGRHATPYPGDVEELSVEDAAQYAAGSDTRNTYDLRRVLVSKLIETGQWKLYTDIERPLVPVVASMEKLGVPVDITKVIKAYVDYSTVEAGMVSHYRDKGYNIRDNSDLRRMLTDELGYDPGTLDQRVLSGYREGVIDLVLFYRTSRTRRNNFLKRIIREWVSAGKPPEFHIYPKYNQAGRDSGGASFVRAPRTGRFSSSNPNFQQQPRDLRDIYVPPKGYKWFKYDYSQLELRLAANLSKDPNLVADLLTGDPHGVFRQYIHSTTGRDPGRPTAKTANFEKLYFGGDAQLVRVLQKERVFIDLSLARMIGQAHASRYDRYYKFGQEIIVDSRKSSSVRTAYGRLRFIPELHSSDPTLRQHGERAAVNHMVQGYAADLVKLVMGMLVPVMNKHGAHLAIQVHDEIDGWVPESADLVGFDKEVRECMQSLITGEVPLLVDGGIRESWAR